MIMLNVLEGELLFSKNVIEGSIDKSNVSLSGDVVNNAMRSLPVYHGTYEITPSDSAQTLNTANMVLNDNIVINPIPSNYGLISWNGSALTVS